MVKVNKQAAKQIAFIDEYKVLLERWFNGEYEPEGKQCLQKSINEMTPAAKDLVSKTGCLRLMSLAPPPMTGGITINNFNPFDMIFQDLYGLSVIPKIINMLEQSVGVIKSGKLDELNNIRHKRVSKFNTSSFTNGIDKIKNYLSTKKWWIALFCLLSTTGELASNITSILDLYHTIIK